MVLRRINSFYEHPGATITRTRPALADRIFRLAFGTFNGLPDPLQFGGDLDKIRTRWLADPGAAFGAEVDGALVGSNFVTHWGSVGYFGPLTVHPDFWDRGVGQKLLEPTLALFEAWGCRHTGLYTYSASPKHLALYQKFGFWPRALTAILSKPVRPVERAGEVSFYSQAPEKERPGLVAAAAGLTDAIYAGLDVQREIFALEDQRLGDTVLVWDDPGWWGSRRCMSAPVPRPGAAPALSNSGRPGPDPRPGSISTGSSLPARPMPRPKAPSASSPGSAWPASPPMSRCGPGALSPRSWACVCISPMNRATTGRTPGLWMIGGRTKARCVLLN